jgi:hypothetical protein
MYDEGKLALRASIGGYTEAIGDFTASCVIRKHSNSRLFLMQ